MNYNRVRRLKSRRQDSYTDDELEIRNREPFKVHPRRIAYFENTEEPEESVPSRYFDYPEFFDHPRKFYDTEHDIVLPFRPRRKTRSGPKLNLQRLRRSSKSRPRKEKSFRFIDNSDTTAEPTEPRQLYPDSREDYLDYIEPPTRYNPHHLSERTMTDDDDHYVPSHGERIPLRRRRGDDDDHHDEEEELPLKLAYETGIPKSYFEFLLF